MFAEGFLGTRALWFMDLVTVWFALLPLLMGLAVFLAAKKRYRFHARAQGLLFGVTMVMVIVFEIGVRVSGGFVAYSEHSSVPFLPLTTLLLVHILIALFAVALWAWLLIDSFRCFQKEAAVSPKHRRYGKVVYAGMTVTSFLGVLIYVLLFTV